MFLRQKVIIADDNPAYRDVLREMLENEKDMEFIGFADDGLQAVAATEENCPDVLLMEITLPKIDGLEVLKRLKEEMSDRIPTIILFSHFINDHTASEAARMGAAYLMAKPSTPAYLSNESGSSRATSRRREPEAAISSRPCPTTRSKPRSRRPYTRSVCRPTSRDINTSARP